MSCLSAVKILLLAFLSNHVNRDHINTMITSAHKTSNGVINLLMLGPLNQIPDICVYHNGVKRTHILPVEKLFLRVYERNYAIQPRGNTLIDWQFMVWEVSERRKSLLNT